MLSRSLIGSCMMSEDLELIFIIVLGVIFDVLRLVFVVERVVFIVLV